MYSPADPEIVIIAAVADNGVIGHHGTLPWHLPEDLARFRLKTIGNPVIMGRKTFQAVGKLPDRPVIVMSRDEAWTPEPDEFLIVVRSMDQALAEARALARMVRSSVIYVAGGEEIYRLFLPVAHRMDLSLIHMQPDGDRHMPFPGECDCPESMYIWGSDE